MNKVRMTQTEEKGFTNFTFDFAYIDRNQEMKWHDKAVVAKRGKDEWTFNTNAVKNLNVLELASYLFLMEKVNQVVETNAMNLMQIEVVHPKATAKK